MAINGILNMAECVWTEDGYTGNNKEEALSAMKGNVMISVEAPLGSPLPYIFNSAAQYNRMGTLDFGNAKLLRIAPSVEELLEPKDFRHSLTLEYDPATDKFVELYNRGCTKTIYAPGQLMHGF